MKILLINPFGIGDVLFTTPLLEPLAEKGHTVHYWVNERVADLVRALPCVGKVWAGSRGDIKRYMHRSWYRGARTGALLFKGVRRERYDVALDFSMDYRYAFFTRLSGIRRRVGFNYKGRGRFLTDAVTVKGFFTAHMVKEYARLAQIIEPGMIPLPRMSLTADSGQREWARHIIRQKKIRAGTKILAVVPGGGASWGQDARLKQWAPARYAEILNALAKHDEVCAILLGSDSEAGSCTSVREACDGACVNMCGQTTVSELAALLAESDVFLGSDGGALHMAVALGCNTVSLYGPTDERVYGPYYDSGRHYVITAHTDCRPCYHHFRYRQCDEQKCLTQIEPDEVLKAVRGALGAVTS